MTKQLFRMTIQGHFVILRNNVTKNLRVSRKNREARLPLRGTKAWVKHHVFTAFRMTTAGFFTAFRMTKQNPLFVILKNFCGEDVVFFFNLRARHG